MIVRGQSPLVTLSNQFCIIVKLPATRTGAPNLVAFKSVVAGEAHSGKTGTTKCLYDSAVRTHFCSYE